VEKNYFPLEHLNLQYKNGYAINSTNPHDITIYELKEINLRQDEREHKEVT